MSTPDRRALVDRGHGELSVRRQCQLLGIALCVPKTSSELMT